MKFFKFMESKFTEHSLNQQVTEFSILADGEQKATQVFMNAARSMAKWWACIKLPIHYLACKIGLTSWPVAPEKAIAEFTARKKAEAEALKKSQLDAKDQNPVSNVVSLESRPVELQ